MVGLAEIGDADQLAVGTVAPAMVGAGEDRRGALVVAAHLHAAMTARIEEDMDLARPVAAQDHQFLAHPRYKEIPRLRDLALMADEQPRAREQPLQLFPVDLLVDKDLAADPPRLHVDEPGPISMLPCGHHVLPFGVLVFPAKAGTHGRNGTGLLLCDETGRKRGTLKARTKRKRSGSWSAGRFGPRRSCGARSAIGRRPAAADPRVCRPGCQSRSRPGCGRSGTGI